MNLTLHKKILNSSQTYRFNYKNFFKSNQNNFQKLNKKIKAQGFTLIELLISMCLGSLVLFAAISFQSQSFKYYLQGHDQLDTNQSKQSVLQQLKKVIGNAGYLAEYPPVPEWNKICFAAINNFPEESVVYGINRSISDGQSDDLFVQFFGNSEGTVQNCQGLAIAANQRVEIRVHLDTTKSQLMCDNQIFQRTESGDDMCESSENLILTAKNIVIGNKIRSFQVLYGLPVNSADYRWLKASDLSSNSTYPWKDVTAIQFGMISEFGKNYSKKIDANLFGEKMSAKPGEVLKAEKTTLSIKRQSF